MRRAPRPLRAEIFNVSPHAVGEREREIGAVCRGHAREPHVRTSVAISSDTPDLKGHMFACHERWGIGKGGDGVRPECECRRIGFQRESPAIGANGKVDPLRGVPAHSDECVGCGDRHLAHECVRVHGRRGSRLRRDIACADDEYSREDDRSPGPAPTLHGFVLVSRGCLHTANGASLYGRVRSLANCGTLSTHRST